MPRNTKRAVLLLSLCVCIAGLARAQQVSRVSGTSFKVQLETFPAPFETQIKTSLEGKRAEPQPGGFIIFTEPQLKHFNTNGSLEIQVRAPECLLNLMQRTVSSTNTLQVELTDGRFYMEGRGFLQMTNGTLLLSNDVRTVIRTTMKAPGKP
ncbi:MAG TPA: hypothetical protein VEH04_21010 [Verrucomicrobiae bacterium]|nr:hypothetical protein [Verrucomicrobiae bacterium]